MTNRAAVRFVCCKFARMNEPLYAAIWRGKANGSFRTYEVPRHESQTVLDVVTYVQRHLDPSLAYRIACRVCYAACDVVGWRADFLGPAALNRAWTLVNDERDTDGRVRLRAVAGDAGCHACHTQGSCTQWCPKHLAPTAAIAGLKRATAKAALRGEL